MEFSPDMLEMARRRVELNGWRNVTLIEGDANTVDIPGPLDAALAFFVPEILNSPVAVRQALDSLSPGGRLVASGVRHARGPLGPLFNFYFQARFRTWRWVGVRRVIHRMLGRGQPYAVLEASAPNLERWDYMLGCAYVATGNQGVPNLWARATSVERIAGRSRRSEFGQRIIAHMNTYDAQARKTATDATPPNTTRGSVFRIASATTPSDAWTSSPASPFLISAAGTGLSFEMLQQGVGPQEGLSGLSSARRCLR